ncbi:sodium:proton antiporter NhaD [Dokdonella fugitiva]|uniref:Na+/H+ antiporter NhaD/arsenite permease-like protein n=1 Tax=Dokdonella fugitiva TaxID=328517 RepID=A0A4R2IA21_9GAMM|nr:sodium:proton antiporter NhaD [Dokdonella fugitiva]MBA8884869.1 Na+/H+ antiporter NhaD/arsenite permease-like protein [Dokdonella fugitiva]TCO40886.1 Na+/H+ antiporter NhaD/arsenite permease-like protein [Dokdonella fugitiva]
MMTNPLMLPLLAAPAAAEASATFGLTAHPVGWIALALFVLAYAAVIAEERLHIAKSKPVMLAAGLMWGLLAWWIAHGTGDGSRVSDAFQHMFLEYAEVFFFLVVAMTYVTAIGERGVFDALRDQLVRRRFGYRSLFWITGALAFLISPVLDNLTTALVMSAVILAVCPDNRRFVTLAFINLVVAANAGGAWSAFGDITTLMVWQARKVEFAQFFAIFVPSLVNWLVPAAIMHFSVPAGRPEPVASRAEVKVGGFGICIAFALTIAITVAGRQWLGMPAAYGMLTGLALLNIIAARIEHKEQVYALAQGQANVSRYSIFRIIANAEWDTLLFFYGVFACVGALAAIGYLELASQALYGSLGYTWANTVIGVLSAVVDNIPIMFAVLGMDPAMDHGQWLLVTLTAGVGGSLLSIGSAAGVALMGASRGLYTFGAHLRWSGVIALGYAASILVHLWLNARHFTG